MDLYHRKVIGWSLSNERNKMTTKRYGLGNILRMEIEKMSVNNRDIDEGLVIFIQAELMQYASKKFVMILIKKK
jgi:hypothetical protein